MQGMNRRESVVESTRYGSASRRIARNRLISFANGRRETGPVLIPIPSQVFPSRIHRGSRSILFYRPLEEMRGRPALIKTLNRKCGLRRNGGGWWYVELSRSNRTSETSGTFDINRFYVCIINLVENCVSIKIIVFDQREFFCGSLEVRIIWKILRMPFCLIIFSIIGFQNLEWKFREICLN